MKHRLARLIFALAGYVYGLAALRYGPLSTGDVTALLIVILISGVYVVADLAALIHSVLH